jgi:hypothetical protein
LRLVRKTGYSCGGQFGISKNILRRKTEFAVVIATEEAVKMAVKRIEHVIN